MKFINKLTDEELKELYRMFTDSDAIIHELTITRFDDFVNFKEIIEIPEFDEEILKETPNVTIVTDDDYDITDYHVKAFHHSGNSDKIFRKFMYKKNWRRVCKGLFI